MEKIIGCSAVAILLVVLTAGTCAYCSPPGYHTVDYNPPDWYISLPELLRVIQLFNSGGYHCDPVARDGYAPGSGPHDCAPYDSDYKPQDWKIDLAELLRIIQLYSSGGYHVQQGTEDGYAPGPPTTPSVTSFTINGGAATTMPLNVTLDNTAANGPTEYMASESASFTGASWRLYSTAPSFTLSFGLGTRTAYFKVRNSAGESGVVSDTIFVVPNTRLVVAGTFNMGRTNWLDDALGGAEELPVHAVTLGAYQIGKGEVTNKEYGDVLNWAKAQGYLYGDMAGTPWPESGDIYAGETASSRYLIVSFTSTDCNIQYSGGLFSSKTRVGLPGTTNYSMDTHPMVCVSWYGSVAFCNWLSQWQGLTQCYNMATAVWPLTTPPPTSGGYRLPTEAEWERAAAWGSGKHWIYGYTDDGLGTSTQVCNFRTSTAYVNPLGLMTHPYVSPDAWFDGVHVSPNGNVTTLNSVSPAGAYDMSGNVSEWCHDLYLATYYSGGAMTNPTGPATGTNRVYRGGSWMSYNFDCRTARRSAVGPSATPDDRGFRIVRTP